MKKQLYTSLAIIFAGLFLFPGTVFGGTVTQTVEKEIYSEIRYCTLIFKHNSIGYWQIDNLYGNATIYDRYIDYSKKTVTCFGTFRDNIQLSKELIDARKKGDVRIEISPCGKPSAVDFSNFTYAFTSLSTLKLDIGLKPSITAYNLSDFVSGMNSFTPLIDYRYGYNQYIVYSLPGSRFVCQGFFDWLYPKRAEEPLVHPSIIKNSKGAFVSGSSISIDGVTRKTTFYNIGKASSFMEGSSVNLVFYAPYKISYFITETVITQDPETDPDKPVVPDVPDEPDLPDEPDEPDNQDPQKENPKTWGLRIHRLIFSVLEIFS